MREREREREREKERDRGKGEGDEIEHSLTLFHASLGDRAVALLCLVLSRRCQD